MNAQPQDWDNLHLVLAIVKGGGLSGAARLLGVHHSTVLRRLDSLEHTLGVSLFERTPNGYRPTINGEELAAIASEMEDHVLGAFRKVAGKDLRLSGILRIATTDYLAVTVLPNLLRGFRMEYPDIDLEVTISTHMASLTKRDADVALRPTNAPPENLMGRKICELAFATYHAQNVLPGAEPSWICVDDAVSHSSPYQWRQQHFPNAQATVSIDSLLGIFETAKAGLGTAILPCYMADPEPCLQRTGDTAPSMTLGLWLLTHPDLQRAQRVRVFMTYAAQRLDEWFRAVGTS